MKDYYPLINQWSFTLCLNGVLEETLHEKTKKYDEQNYFKQIMLSAHLIQMT